MGRKIGYTKGFHEILGSATILEETNNSITYTSKGLKTDSKGNPTFGDGPTLVFPDVLNGKIYRLSYDITILEGYVTTFGGHLHLGDTINLYLDGNLKEKTDGSKLTATYPVNDYTKHHVDVTFDVKHAVYKENGILSNTTTQGRSSSIMIQPNRDKLTGSPYSVKIENIKLIEVSSLNLK